MSNYLALVLGTLYVLWVYYLACMNLQRAIEAKTIRPVAKWIGILWVLPPAWILDLLVNLTVFTLLFWNLPSRPLELVTGRLTRYVNGDDGWRRRLAIWIAINLLNEFDPSGHHVVVNRD